MARKDASRSRSRSRKRRDKKSRSRDRKRSPSTRRKRSRSRSRDRRRERSASRRRSPTREALRELRSRSRKQKRRSRTPERTPPTNFSDYEPATDGSGWYVYKKTSKWKYHPETGLYLHIKSSVYYVAKDGDTKNFRKIDDDDDPVVRKMKQSEEMRKAIQNTEFVTFGEGGGGGGDAAAAAKGPAAPAAPEAVVAAVGTAKPPPMPEPVDEGDKKTEGKVREWNPEKGFGFIVPLGLKEGEDQVAKSIFVHLWNVVGSTHQNPINLREGSRVQFKLGEQDGRPRALEVMMLGKDGKPLDVHKGATTLEEKRKSYHVTAESLSVRVHCESWPGKQTELKDRHTLDEAMDELGVFFGVFDGHGGAQVSELASKQLHKNILSQFRQKQVQPASRDEKLKVAVRDAFLHTDKEILSLAERKKFETVGSTGLVALLHGNPKLGTALRLILAHVGDSRAILCRAGQGVAMTDDHNPSRLDEKKRIERVGGLVLNVRGAWRIAAPAKAGASKAQRREYSGLAMTRSLGDSNFKSPSALSVAEPEVKVMSITDKDLFLILATDGITSVLSNQEIVDCAGKHWDDAEEAAKNVVRTAFQKGSDENITAVIIQFGWQDKLTPKYLEKRKALVAQGLDGGSPKLKPGAAPAEPAAKDDFDMFG